MTGDDITDEQIDAIFDGWRFVARRTFDKLQYEVVENTDDDPWEALSCGEWPHHGFFASHEDAERAARRLHVRWVLSGGVP